MPTIIFGSFKMTSRVTTAFSIFQANSFMKFFSDLGKNESLYAFTSDCLPIDNNEENDILPPNPEINQNLAKSRIYDNALTAVKINSSSASRVTKRFDWKLGATFVPYSTEINTITHSDPFYCLSESFDPITGSRKLDVYKCLYSPRDSEGNILSVGWNNIENGRYRPSGDSVHQIDVTDDFYRWFYMYSVYPYQETAFLSDTLLPVPETPSEESLNDLIEGTQKYQLRLNIDNAVEGTIFNISVIDGGRNLIDGKHRVQVFNGSLQKPVTTPYIGFANIKNGTVTHIELNTPGVGYTGSVSIRLPDTATNDTSVLPKLVVDVSPGIGHGADCANELGANYILINVRKYFSSEERGTVTRNDFRTLSIIRNPIDESTGGIAQNEYYDLTHKMKMSNGIEGVTEDSFIIKTQIEPDTGATKTALVVGVGKDETDENAIDGTLLSVIPKGSVYPDGTVDYSKTPAAGEAYRLKTENGEVVLSSDFLIEYTKPIIRKYSGEVLQIEHRKPLNRMEGQIETFTFVFSF